MSKDFTPITLAATFPTVIMIQPSVPARNVQEFVALVKSQPGKFAYSSAGTGNGSHLTVELFRGGRTRHGARALQGRRAGNPGAAGRRGAIDGGECQHRAAAHPQQRRASAMAE